MKLTREEQDIVDSYHGGEWEPLENSEEEIAKLRAAAAETLKHPTNYVMLEPDVFAQFPNSESVNKALRTLMEKK